MSNITFIKTVPAAYDRSTFGVAGEAGKLVKGVAPCEFIAFPTATQSSNTVIHISSIIVNGVGYEKVQIHVNLVAKRVVFSMGQRFHSPMSNLTYPAEKKLNELGKAIMDAMVSSDLVASVLVENSSAQLRVRLDNIDKSIAEMQRELEDYKEARANLAADIEAAGTELDGQGLNLALQMMRDGISFGEAVTAAAVVLAPAPTQEEEPMIITVPATSTCWANREQAELRDDLVAAGVQFPLTFEVTMEEGRPATISGLAFSWSSERAGDVASHVVACDSFVANSVIDFVYGSALATAKAGR